MLLDTSNAVANQTFCEGQRQAGARLGHFDRIVRREDRRIPGIC
jgi:hypothetical protein